MAAIRPSTLSLHQQNIAMLMEKLKEVQMSTENSSADALIYSKVESKFFHIFSLLIKGIHVC